MKQFKITGDCHGNFQRFFDTFTDKEVNKNIAIIILGDTGINYTLKNPDKKLKAKLQETGLTFYCVRGNHEERPEYIVGMIEAYDEEVKGNVYLELDYPNIKYFKDGGVYEICGRAVLTIGGAYSVDKHYRLAQGWPYKWFPSEQLTAEEMTNMSNYHGAKHYDIVLTHTCPYSWMPTDLFLDCVDQSTVDNTMEKWFEQFKEEIDWGIWCFGHYHADRIERPYVEQYYRDIEAFEEIIDRWERYKKTNELDWWLNKSPNFYMG